MTDSEIRQIMVKLAELSTKLDAMKEDINELKDWRNKILMIVVSTVIVAGIGVLFGTGTVRL